MPESSYNQFCPVAMAAEILGSRWTLVLLRELLAMTQSPISRQWRYLLNNPWC